MSPQEPSREALVQAARLSIRKGSASFRAASRLFDKTTRERVWMLYAWCRACDDIADDQDHGGPLGGNAAPGADQQAQVESIRALTRRAFAGEWTGEPAFDALGQLAREAPVTLDMAEDVIAGFALDAAEWRPRSEADMLRYCYHVAGAVGVMMAAVMGVPEGDEDTLDRACDLGIAFQLNNIVRDVAEDDAADRRYLPVEWTVEEDIPPGELTKPHYRDGLIRIVARACTLAQGYEASARVGAARLRFRQRWAILAAANIYGAIGRKVMARGQHAWDHRVRTTRTQKLALVLSAGIEAWRAAPAPAQPPGPSRRELAALART